MSINEPMNPHFLAHCPVENGFRLRGIQMTRIEVFVDAAFAFALTMLVISAGALPRTLAEMLQAMQGIPTFAATFMMMVLFWSAHRNWSRRFGVEDRTVVMLSCFFVFVMLIFVYPLRMVFSSMFHFMSAGRLPSDVQIETWLELRQLFIVYGIGFALLSLVIIALNAHAWRMRERLQLNALEMHDTWAEAVGWLPCPIVALLSILLALVLPDGHVGLAGFAYFLLAISGPVIGIHFGRKRRTLENRTVLQNNEA